MTNDELNEKIRQYVLTQHRMCWMLFFPTAMSRKDE